VLTAKWKRATVQEELTVHLGRAVTIPDTVENYVIESVGHRMQALDNSLSRCECLDQTETLLLVLTRGFGINTKNAIGALSHNAIIPEPQSLLDALKPKEQSR
jgi:hypothetical protein